MLKSLLRPTIALCLLAAGLVSPAAAQSRLDQGEAVVFKDPGFRGTALRIDGPVANLALARFNDTISSIRVRGPWEICVDPDFRGKCTIIEGSVDRLADIRMNDNITSMRPLRSRRDDRNSDGYGHGSRRGDDDGRRGHTVGRSVTLFRDPDFSGAAIDITRPIADLKRAGFNDTASSLGVNTGTWLVCEDPDFRGRCELVSGSLARLSDIGLNDRVSSLRPVSARELRAWGH